MTKNVILKFRLYVAT